MRLAAALALLLLAPAAQAAFLQDPEGDVRVDGDAPAPVPGGPAYASLDLTALDVVEDADAFTFTLHVADLGQGADDPAPEGMVCDLEFTHGGRGFRVHLSRLAPALEGFFADLYTRDEGGAWEPHFESGLEATLDGAADTITYVLPRAALADRSGAAPFPGRALEGIVAACVNAASRVSLVGPAPTLPLVLRDDMPDPGAAAASWPVTVGVAQQGHALLTSEQPFRASNGEATTFAFNVTAKNLGEADDTMRLSARDVPDGVTVRLAQDQLTVPGGGQLAFTVWVSVPFAHDHGAKTAFVLEAASTSDPGSVGRIELGVRYLAVPQPAGHHDTLFVHAWREEGPGADTADLAPGIYGIGGYLNTLQDDPGDSGKGIAFGGGGSDADAVVWVVDLSPSLLVGLDADLARVGRSEMVFGSRTPLDQATLQASLNVAWGDGVVEVVRSEPVPFEPRGEAWAAVADLVPQAQADLVPFHVGAHLWLELRLVDAGAGGDVPGESWLLPGSWLQLPLLDYHDAIEGLPAEGGAVLAGAAPVVPEEDGKESPMTPLLPLGAVALASLVRRRLR